MKKIALLVCLFIVFSIYPTAVRMVKKGQRFSVILDDTSISNGYKWNDPTIDRAGILNFEGRRKIGDADSEGNGSGAAIFTFYALKSGDARIDFTEKKVSIPGRNYSEIIRIR